MDTERPILDALAAMDPDKDIEFIAHTMGAIEELIRRAKEFKVEFERQCMDWIEVNGRDIEIPVGDGEMIRYYIGNRKETKCRDVKETLASLLELTGGDLDAVAVCLSANAWKHGQIKKTLENAGRADRFDAMFSVEEKTELAEGKPVKIKKY